jgi:uncharacterized protein (TIGR03084 family)
MSTLRDVLADLAAEGDWLDELVAPLTEARWTLATPAEGWTVAHQIGHLAWTDELSILAASDPAAFGTQVAAASEEIGGYVDRAAAEKAQLPHGELLAGWRASRAAVVRALSAVPDATRIPWFGPPMSTTSMATARLMETWAHGQDVADALGVARPATTRLRHVAHLGVRTRDFAYRIHAQAPPGEPFRVELAGPGGESWTWGPADAAQRVTGSALDFCLLVTQRRHRGALDVAATGPDADEWLDIAQAFAGPPGGGRSGGGRAPEPVG